MPGRDLRRRNVQHILYTSVALLADFIQDVFCLFKDERPHKMPSEAIFYSQEDLFNKLKEAPVLEAAKNRRGESSVLVLDDSTIVKMVLYDSDEPVDLHYEALNMKFVFDNTTIPTPKVHLVLPDPVVYDLAYVVMDYIHGHRLDHIWPQLSIWSKLRVAWILRSYIRQLRSITRGSSPVPGPLGPYPRPYPEGTIDPLRQRGPFSDATELTAFLNSRSTSIRRVSIPPEYENPEPLVFTHADLNMRNIILDDDGRVWLIDWGWSGFYPRSWEFISMALQAEAHPSGQTPLSWRRCVPFITSPDFRRYRWSIGFSP